MADRRARAAACWRWAGCLVLVLAGVVGAAAPAAAQTAAHIISRAPSGTLHDGNLDSMEIHFGIPNVNNAGFSSTQYYSGVNSRYTVQGAPPGANVWIRWADNASSGFNVQGYPRSRRGHVRVGFSGSYTADWNLTIRLAGGGTGSYFNGPSYFTIGPITIRARPKPALRLSPASISENGGVATVTATLSAAHSAPVTVTVGATPVAPATSSDFTLSSNRRLTFAANATTSSGTVTLTGVNNTGTAAAKSVTVTGTTTGGTGIGVSTPAARTLRILDDEQATVTPTLVLSPAAIAENGGVATVTATLDRAPSAAVTITVSAAAGAHAGAGDYTLSSNRRLTFAAGSTASTGVVTLTATNNTAASPHKRVTVSGVAAGNNTRHPAPVTLTIQDDDGGEIVLSASTLAVTEGEEASYTVRLSQAPTGNVRVIARGNAFGSLRVTWQSGGPYYNDMRLDFTTSNWNTGQTVYVEGREDGNMADETVTIGHATVDYATVAEYQGRSKALQVNVTDNDVLTVSPRAVTVQEGGSGGSYTVVLNRQPTGPVTVTARSTTAAVALDTDGTPQTVDLTFSTTNWNTPQAVTVRPADDADGVDETVTVRHAATAGSGDPSFSIAEQTQEDVTVTVDDDDPAPGVTLSAAAVSVNEDPAAGGGTTAHEGTYTVALAAGLKAGESVAVEVSSGDADAVQVGAPGGTLGNTAQVTFTPSTWNTPQTVTAQARTDADGRDEAVTLSHRIATASVASGYPTTLTVAAVTVNVDDKDTPGLVVDTDPSTPATTESAPLAVTEPATPPDGSEAATYTLALATEPAGPVTVTVTSDAAAVAVDTDGTPQTVDLTFSTMSWNTAQTVTATAVGDADSSDEMVTLSHAAAAVSTDTEYNFAARAAEHVTVNVTDDDTPGLTLSGTTLTVGEGATNTYTVALATAPGGPVTVEAAVPAASDLTVDTDGTPETVDLTFSTTSWNTAQTVTVSAGDDDDGRNDTAQATHRVTSSDAGYAGLETSAPARVPGVAVTVTDDDTIAVTVDTDLTTMGVQTTTLSVSEDGMTTTAAYTVVLGTEPQGPVTVQVGDDPNTAGVDDLTKAGAEPATLTFTAGSWDTAQTVTVTGKADDDDDNVTVSLAHTVTSGDTDYDGLSANSVAVTVTDDDTAGLAVSAAAAGLTVGENASGTYTVALTTQPAGPVTVGVARTSGSTDVSAVPTPLTFSATTWNTAQTVTVSVADDDDASADSAVVSHTVSGTGDATSYPTTLAAVTVTITGTDDDTPGLVVDPQTLAVTEPPPATNAAAPYTVRLATLPGGPVTVTVTSADAAVTVDADSTPQTVALTFSTTSWNTAQTVTVTAVDDANTVSEEVTLSHAAAAVSTDTEYNFTARATEHVTVTVTDGDTPNLAVNATGLTGDGVTEGTAEPYTVALTTQPGGPVTVTVRRTTGNATLATGTQAAGDSVTLAYSGTSWNTAQTVTVAAGEDDDAVDGTVVLTHDPGGDADYAALADVRLTFTVTDNDMRGVVLDADPSTPAIDDAGPLTLTEEHATAGNAPYTVRLATQPVGGQVTVTIAATVGGSATGAVTVSPGTLRFTASNWDTAQRVTARAPHDANSTGESVTLTHTAIGGDYPAAMPVSADLAVTVTDNDLPGLWVSTPQLTIAEEATRPYTVRLNTAPSGNVLVTVGVTPAGKIEVDTDPDTNGSQDELTFTPGNWGTAQTVEVKALADDDGADVTGTLTHAVGGASEYVGLAAQARPSVAVTVEDDEEPGVTVDTEAGTDGAQTTLGPLKEDGGMDASAPYTVVLTTEPTTPVTLSLSTSPTGAVTVAPGALTYTASDWQTAQTVTASAEGDADAADERVTLTHAPTGAPEYAGGMGVPAVMVPNVTVTVEDNEEQAVWVDTDLNTAMRQDGPLEVNEDASATYTVELGSEPVDPVVVRIGSDNPDVHAMPRLVRFDANDWNTAQTVTVRADGDVDAQADGAALTHRAAGGDYTGAAPEVTVQVTVTDDDAGVVISRRAVTVQGGARNTYTVRLAAQPAGPVTVTATSPDADVAVGPAGSPGSRELVFTAGTWQTPQAVTVTGGTVTSDKAVLVTHTVSGYGTVTTAADVRVTVLSATGALRVDPLALALLEDGPAGTYTIRTRTQPTDPVTVTVVVSNTNSVVSVMPVSLTFDATMWAARAVTVTVVTDTNTTTGSATLNHTVTTVGFTAQAQSPVSVTEIEDVTPTLAAVSNQTYRAGQAVNARLGAAATGGNAPLRYMLTGPGAATDLTLPAGLTFEPATRRIQGTPGAMAVAETFTLTVTDANGDPASQTFTLEVEANPLPGFTEPAARYTRGETYTLPAPDVQMGTTPTLTFVVEPALPAGLTYVPPTANAMGAYETGGQIVGTPTGSVPTRPYTLTVVDADGNEAETTFALAVAAAPPPAPADRQPTFGDATVAAQVYRQGEAIPPLLLPAATDGDAPLRYTLTPALPAGLTYTAPADPTSGGMIAGEPTAAQAATTYTLTATDADGDEATLPFTIAVEAAAGAIRPQDGTQTVTIYGQPVTVTQAPGTLAGVTLTLPETLAQAVTITLTPPAADVPLERGRYGFGPAGPAAAVDIEVTPVPADGIGICLPVPAAVRAEAAGRAVVLLHYDGRQWAPVARAQDEVAEGQVCAAGVTTFSPFAVGYANAVPRFAQTVGAQTYRVNEAIAPLVLPAATGGDGTVRYTLTPATLPAGLSYSAPADPTATGGVIAGTPSEGHAVTAYTLTATDADGDTDTRTFTIEVIRLPVQVTIDDATAAEGAAVEFTVTLSRAVARPLTLQWTAGRPGSATPGDDYPAEAAGEVQLAAGTTAGTLAVRTLDDRRVEPTETFTVTVTLPDDPLLEITEATAVGRIEDDDTEQARQRSLGMVLAGVGRTLATDAVDVIGDRFIPQPPTRQVTVGGQAVSLDRDAQTGRWRHAAGVAYGVARALGVEVGAPVAGGDGQFGQVRGAAWSTLTRHLRDPHSAAAPQSAWDTPGAFAVPSGPGWGGPPAAHSIPLPAGSGSEPAPDVIRGSGRAPAQDGPADTLPFGRGAWPGLAGYGTGLGQLGFDRAHAATPQAMTLGTLRAPVQFRRVSGAEVLSQSEFEIPLSQAAADPAARVAEADPTLPVETAPQAEAAAWTLWGRGTASGFNGQPKDDFSMDGNVFTGYLGLDYRLQPNVLLGLAVAHSQGDVDYETTDVTKGAVDITLTSILPYAHWSPRPGLGVWGLFGAGWGDLDLRDEAGKVKTDLEMLMAAVGARQELLTWRQIDVAVKADAFLTELEAGADDRLPKTAGDAQRLRLMLEGRTAWAVSEASHLTPIFEIGGRWDGGKAETGVGAELGGGFEYAHTKLGLGIEARGRYLLAHQKSAFDEWGASLTLKLDPGADKRGLWLALAPVWGAEASQVEQMWGSADVLRAGAETDAIPGLSPAQVEFDVGYGVVTHEGMGLLTTYGGLSMAGPDNHGYRLGGRIELGEWVDLSVEGERTTQGGGAEHQVALYGHLGW